MESPWVFWLVFGTIFSLLLLFKVYMRRGYRQALGPKYRRIAHSLSLFSILIHFVGFATIIIAFSRGIINMTWQVNFVVALMMSVLICEIFLFNFVLLDDVIIFLRFVWRKWTRRKASNAKPIPQPDRRRFLKTAGLALSAIPFGSFLWGITKGKYSFRQITKTLVFPDLPDAFDGFKIVQISDIHSGSFDSFENVARGVQMVQDAGGDMILFTGDLVNDLAEEIIPYKELFAKLSAKYGKFSTLGNHDYAEDPNVFRTDEEREENLNKIKGHHKDMGFRMMNNENTLIEKDGQSIRLVGVENWGRGPFTQRGDLNIALEGSNDDEFTILMSHDPTHWTEKVLPHDKHVHLTLSGHTHGMQMGVELPYIKWSPVQYVYPQWAGLYAEADQMLYVNRGFGFIGFAGRVGVLPEITLIELRKA